MANDYHIHSTFSDGHNTIDEIAQFCKQNNMSKIAITDHVRETLSYDFSEYLSTIENTEEKYGIRIVKGIEAKILPNGDLDMPKDIEKQAEIIIGAIHGWPEDIPFEKAYELLVQTPCTIIGHVKFLDEQLIELFLQNGKTLEINHQYPLSEKELQLIKKYPQLKISFGSNTHNIADILPAQKYFEEIKRKYVSNDQLWKFE